jgi:hypothetical protein
MEDIEDYLSSSRLATDKIRAGLKLVGEEEENLKALRAQLAKIKKIREEQLKKDELISQLKEKVVILEYDRSSALKQNTDLQEIMSERINTLERYLTEKEVTEKQYQGRIITLEYQIREYNILQEELELERQR